jgi:hypothetical protein
VKVTLNRMRVIPVLMLMMSWEGHLATFALSRRGGLLAACESPTGIRTRRWQIWGERPWERYRRLQGPVEREAREIVATVQP